MPGDGRTAPRLPPALAGRDVLGTEIFAVIHLGIMALSHILAPKVWIDFFRPVA